MTFKTSLFLSFFLSLSIPFSTFGQVKQDSLMLKYIAEKPGFVNMANLDEIPSAVRSNYDSISSYMEANEMNLADYWTTSTVVEKVSRYLKVDIYHYDGFVVEYRINCHNQEVINGSQDLQPNKCIAIDGNQSGKDGTFLIDTLTRKVLSFSIWI